MPSFLVDEDLPRSLARALTQAGHPSSHIHDAGLTARPDLEVFDFALSNGLAVVPRDVGYSNLHRLSRGAHHGILICRFHKAITMEPIKKAVVDAVVAIDPRDLPGALFVVSHKTVRRRRK